MEDVRDDYAKKVVPVGEERVLWGERSLRFVQKCVLLELHSSSFLDRPEYLSCQVAQAIECGKKS